MQLQWNATGLIGSPCTSAWHCTRFSLERFSAELLPLNKNVFCPVNDFWVSCYTVAAACDWQGDSYHHWWSLLSIFGLENVSIVDQSTLNVLFLENEISSTQTRITYVYVHIVNKKFMDELCMH
jgi:hypothetical protein